MTQKATKELLKKLEEAGREKGVPSRLLEFYLRLVSIQAAAEQRISRDGPALKKEVLQKRAARKLPMLSFNELAIDWAVFKDTFAQVTAAFADYTDLFGELPKGLREPEHPASLPKKVVKAWFEKAEMPATSAVEDMANT